MKLLLSPADELTPIFVSEINRVAADRPIALFFDTYERTGLVLDRWLRSLYTEQYGGLPETLITTISGQNPLNPNLWGEYLPVIVDISLEPFSETEARQFLASKGIHDESTIQVILTLSGCLPMWLATLAEARPSNLADIGDPAGDAVERFLKWEHHPARRDIALTAALPRTLNQDVLSTIAAAEDARELFDWLCRLPFVTRRAGSWAYHEVVRAAMLRLQLAQAPNEWRSNQIVLAQANRRWAREGEGTNKTWRNPAWIDYTREETYHRLCADPINNLPEALASAVYAGDHSTIRARQWARLIADAGRDTGNQTLRQWGQRLRDSIDDSDLTQYFTSLISHADLDRCSQAIALGARGAYRSLAHHYDDALADLNRAIELDPDDAWAIAAAAISTGDGTLRRRPRRPQPRHRTRPRRRRASGPARPRSTGGWDATTTPSPTSAAPSNSTPTCDLSAFCSCRGADLPADGALRRRPGRPQPRHRTRPRQRLGHRTSRRDLPADGALRRRPRRPQPRHRTQPRITPGPSQAAAEAYRAMASAMTTPSADLNRAIELDPE